MPQEPDKKVKGLFKLKGTEIEVVGVCKFWEDGGQCWNMKGEVDSALTERTLARYREGGDQAGRGTGNYMFKKNRVVLGRVLNPSSKFEARMTSFYFSENADAQAMQSTPANQEHLILINTSLSDKTAHIDASVVEPIGITPEMPCRVGAEIEHDGLKFRIANIETQGSRWMISVQITPDQKPMRSFVATALDAQGKAITHTDPNGKPISEAVAGEALIEYQRQRVNDPNSDIPSPAYRSGKPAVASIEKNGFRVATNVDPKHIDRLYFTVTKLWKIQLTDIPLDPVKRK